MINKLLSGRVSRFRAYALWLNHFLTVLFEDSGSLCVCYPMKRLQMFRSARDFLLGFDNVAISNLNVRVLDEFVE